MKKVFNATLFLFVLALLMSMFSCKKAPKTRTAGYQCHLMQETYNSTTNQWDTVIISTADFPYPALTAQQQEDSLNIKTNVPHLWYDCN